MMDKLVFLLYYPGFYKLKKMEVNVHKLLVHCDKSNHEHDRGYNGDNFSPIFAEAPDQTAGIEKIAERKPLVALFWGAGRCL